MNHKNSVEQFIEFARTNLAVREKLADCQVEDWDKGHLPLDIDIEKVIAIAKENGYQLTWGEIIRTQCKKLEEFWRFEMENSFVARRALEMIQYQVEDHDQINYYEY